MSVPKTALVTGGTKRIGQAIVDALADDGWHVAVHYLSSKKDADEVCKTLSDKGLKTTCVQADLTDEAAVRRMYDTAASEMGGLRMVINNASIFEVDDALTEDPTLWDRHMAAHVRAPFVLTQCLAKNLPEDVVGSVINIIDQRVFNPTPHLVSYSLSKMALWDQTQILARALAPQVRINAVGPGPVLPGPRQDQEDFDLQAAQTPLGKSVHPKEIADAVTYLANASSVTGQMIAVDSGQFMNWAFETEETKPKE